MPRDEPALPPWFRRDDPWLTTRMRHVAEIDDGEARLGRAVSEAIAEFLAAARDAVLGDEPTVVTAAGVEPPPPDLSRWPGESRWRELLDRVVAPVITGLFGERFRAATASAAIADYPYRQAYLAEVWSRLTLWPSEAFDDVRSELAEGVAEGETPRQLRERVGEALSITARSKRVQAEIAQLTKTIDNPDTRPGIRREARKRRSALYRSKDREDQHWWFYAARIARTETVGALNAGTFYGATARSAETGEAVFKQWWCLTPENTVTAAGVTWIAHRDYDGPVVRLVTDGGTVLTLTPQHPVLTPDGWVPVAELAAGSRLVRLESSETGRAIGELAESCFTAADERGFTREVTRQVGDGPAETVRVCPPDPYVTASVAPSSGEPLAGLAWRCGEAELPDRAEREPGLVVETVRQAQWGYYTGPVYDLTTVSGFFAGPGGVLVHNSTSDSRVRPSHWAAHMQVQPLDEAFQVGGVAMDHPGDPAAPPREVVNCRCSLLTMGSEEADEERQRWQQFRQGRTDVHGRPLDEQGRPVTAAATTPSGAAMTETFGAEPQETEAPSSPSDAPGGALTWSGVLAPLGVPSGDNRRIDAPDDGELSTRQLPVPLLFQPRLAQGHAEAEQGLAVITSAQLATGEQVREQGMLTEPPEVDKDALFLVGHGRFDAADDEAAEIARKIDEGYLRWVSVDLDQVGSPRYHKYRGETDLGEVEIPEEGLQTALSACLDEGVLATGQFGIARDESGSVTTVAEPWAALEHAAWSSGAPSLRAALNTDAGFRARLGIDLADDERLVEVVTQWRLMSATLVGQPAFHEAFVVLDQGSHTSEDEPDAAEPPENDDPGIIEAGLLDSGEDTTVNEIDGEDLPEQTGMAALAEQINAALGAASFAVTGDTSLPIADRDRPWDGAAARARLAEWATTDDGDLDGAMFARAHLYRDPEADPTTKGAYKLPVADIIGGRLTLVPRGVFAAAAAIQGSRGGVAIPEADRAGVKRKLAHLYRRIREKEDDEEIRPPWQGGTDRSRRRIDRSKPQTTGVGKPRRFGSEDSGTVSASGTPQQSPPPSGGESPARRSAAALTAAADSWAHRVAEAADELHEPPAEFFDNPNLLRPTNPTVTARGRVFGHIHDWTTAHIGYSGRTVRAPRSTSNYAYFNLKPVRCSDGSYVRCGALVLGAHHADTAASANTATDHYDHSGYRVARIRAGEDRHGTWFSGALVPGVTAEQVLDIAELTCSGDWRDGELRAALLVNVPGLPIVEGSEVDPAALVAAGAIARPDGEVGIADDPDSREEAGQTPSAAEIARAVVAEQRALAAREQTVARLSRHVHAPQIVSLANRVHHRQ
ncbi:hypothetical protein IL38_24180 [Actinopolyspora erythraea]|uniref:Intein C-terminal splicing domain-containing protein n=1 Tax=Actinopolyspora erythraea TaxID=414996 RepID=A0ABR4WYD8_9ACTN|nr:Hint domain-containing protein [Actinopolyspora erythraea]KGI79395.1 hypothetical protein IL38_24180 [Actinopolyspora erythraea]